MNFSKYKLQTYLSEDATAEVNSETASQKATDSAVMKNDRRTVKMASKQQNFSQAQGTAMKNKMQMSSFDAEQLRREKEYIKMMENQRSDWRKDLQEKVIDGQERENHPYVTVMPTGDENLIQAMKQMGKEVKDKKNKMVGEETEQIDEIVGALAGAAKNLATGAMVNGAAANPAVAGAVGGTVGAVTGKKKPIKKAIGSGAGTAVGGAIGGPVGALIGGVVGNKVAESTVRQRVTTKATEVGRNTVEKSSKGGKNAGPNETKGAAVGATLGGIAGIAVPDGPLMVAGEIAGGYAGSKIGGAIGKKFDKKNEEVEELEEKKKECKDGYKRNEDGDCVKKKKSSRTTIILGRGYGGHHHHDHDDDDDNDGGSDDVGSGGDGGGGMGEMFDALGDMLLKEKEMNFRDAQKAGMTKGDPKTPIDHAKLNAKRVAGYVSPKTSDKDRAK